MLLTGDRGQVPSIREARYGDIGSIGYVPVLQLVDGYQPPKPCLAHLHELPQALTNAVPQMKRVLTESVRIANDRLQRLPADTVRLSADQALALAVYTFDLGMDSEADGRDNFYVVLNVLLRKRQPDIMRGLKPYLGYMMQALAALPDWRGVVYRGIPGSERAVVEGQYKEGSTVHWSSFTSTTTTLATARDFARDGGGVVFVIKVLQGRSVRAYSAMQAEDEILLSPNSRFSVTEECALRQDGELCGCYVVCMQQLRGEGILF
jgi:hypothetical protein